MNIYFAGSIRGGREDVKIYHEIIIHLRKFGNVLTEHVADDNLEKAGEKNMSDMDIHDRDMAWLNQSDVVVAEVSVPSLGVGYEIRAAVTMEKKVLCLYRKQKGKRLSAMIAGCSDIKMSYYESLSEAKEIINRYLEFNPR
ncbi:MAG: nucleoside 2-deoxyribosyltransferase [Bacteroidales bacterium]|nr:nucleoside 2-deoxyribosyltransferase [Bacteroidales bacterium]